MLNEKDRLCFSFCPDLGNKEFHWRDLDSQLNIKWSLFRIKQAPDIVGGGIDLPNSDIVAPGNYHIEKVEVSDWSSLLKKSEKYEVFVAPSDYPNRGKVFYENKKSLVIDLPPELKEQPHLLKHSSFQFCFLKNIIFPTSLLYMDIDEQNRIKATVSIYASPAGTYFIFQSGQIPFKWKLDVRQGIMTWNFITDYLGAMLDTTKKIGAGIIKGVSGGLVDLKGDEDKAMNKAISDVAHGKDGFEQMGLGREKINRTQEQETDRKFKSTSNFTSESTLEPSIFNSNSIQFPYNLYDYALRSFIPQFEARIHISKTIYNNLKHNNNQNPITYPLNITFKKLGNILRPGYWQGKLTLDCDPGGKMAECFARGVTFYEDKEKEFPNPNLGIASVQDDRMKIKMGASFYTAQTIVEKGEGITVNIPYTPDQRGYGHSTYIKLTNSSVMDDFKNAVVASCGCNDNKLHYSSQGFCWGCTYDELNKVGFVTTEFTPSADCSVILKLGVNSSDTKDLDLKAGTEYTVTITASQFVFKAQDKTKIVLQKVPQSDDFDKLDWTPPAGMGGEIEIPLNDINLPEPEPGADSMPPEPDMPIPDFDPTGGEPEINFDNPEITPDFDDLDDNEFPDFDPPPIEVDPPFDIDPPKDKDTSQDTEDKDPPKDDEERPEDFD